MLIPTFFKKISSRKNYFLFPICIGTFLLFCLYLSACSNFSYTQKTLPSEIYEIKLETKKIRSAQEKSNLLLETELVNREKSFNAQIEDLKQALVDLKIEIDRTQDELRLLRGQIEELQYQLKQKDILSSSPTQYQGDIKARRPPPPVPKQLKIPPTTILPEEKTTETLSQKAEIQPISPLTQPTSPTLTKATPVSSLPSPNEDTATLQTASQLLGQGKYDKVIEVINKQLSSYSISTKAPELLFLLGESYFYKSDLENAKITFEKIYSEYKDSAKAPDALALLAEISRKKGEIANVISYFEKIITEFPSYSEINKIKEELKTLKQEK